MYRKYIIPAQASIIDALKAINSMESNEALTLFVEGVDHKIVGTVTDGDVRRSLISGKELNSCVGDIANRYFMFLSENNIDVNMIHNAKKRGIELLPILDDQMKIVDVVNLKKTKSYLPIDAVLMAGGKGERLRPLTEKTPKPLIQIGEKAIIDYNVERLISFGIKNINVTINYLGEQLEAHFSKPKEGILVHTIREPQFLGTMGSIHFIEDFHNETILVMNSDLFTNIDYEDFYLHFKEHEADMSVAAVPYNVNIPFGVFELDGRNIKGIKEKPIYHHYANAGIYLFKKEILNLIPEGQFFNATDLIDVLIRNNKKVIRFPINGTWIDIGQHSELQKARDLVKHLK